MARPALPRDEQGNIIREPEAQALTTFPSEEKELPIKLFAHVYINKQLNRTYSYEVHGEKFEELAMEFADQRENSEIKLE